MFYIIISDSFIDINSLIWQGNYLKTFKNRTLYKTSKDCLIFQQQNMIY